MFCCYPEAVKTVRDGIRESSLGFKRAKAKSFFPGLSCHGLI